MSFSFPKILSNFTYSPLPSTDESNSTRLMVHGGAFLHSKRARLTGAVAGIALLVFLLSRTFFPNSSLEKLPGLHQDPPSEPQTNDSVQWSRFAYTQYATNQAYLCNSVMLFEILHRLESKADRLLMYPSDYQIDDEELESESFESRLLRKARDEYNVKLQPIQIQRRGAGDQNPATWAESYTKLLAFNQTQYDRVLSLDSDSTVLQHMDELFLLPPAPMGMPRAYWLDLKDRVLSSQLMLLQPSEFEYNRVAKGIENAGSNDYDMEIVNNLYRDSCYILPHRPYDLLTGEFRAKNHTDYLGNQEEAWDPDAVLKEAKFLHFSDWPVPKPWLKASSDVIEHNKPSCSNDEDSKTEEKGTCREQELWLGFYSDFAQRRKEVCDVEISGRKRKLKSPRALSAPVYRPVFL